MLRWIIKISVSLFFITSVAFPQVNTERYRIPTDSVGFSVISDINLTLMYGNTDFQFLGSNTRFNYNWGKHYSFLIINGGFGQNDGNRFFSQALLHFRNVNSIRRICRR
jgi:hypothetical protein